MIKINTNTISFKSDKAPTAPYQKEVTSTPLNKTQTNKISVTSTVLTQYPNVKMPTSQRNYCVFNEARIEKVLSRGEAALSEISNELKTETDEKKIVENLYILNRMLDNGVKNIDKMYPTLSRFNDTNSPNIQVFLAGIYRKTLVPDAFGPLLKMLIKDSKAPTAPNNNQCNQNSNKF